MSTPPAPPPATPPPPGRGAGSTPVAAATRHDPIYDELAAAQEFREVRRRYAAFVLPATVAFLTWYLLYVVLSNWAHDLMSTKVVGHVNVALVFGLLQFVSTFVIAWRYAAYMNSHVDDLAHDLDVRYQGRAR